MLGLVMMIMFTLPRMENRSIFVNETISSLPAVEVNEAKIQWYYKTVDGVMYKRGYDVQEKKWVTDWIKVKNGKSKHMES